MPAKWLIILLMFSPFALLANEENDIELFEFLAIYEQSDDVFIDAEMENKYETTEFTSEQNLMNQKVTKSESDE
ncbi:MAG: hypothetical protein OQK75_08105 [Gammaproteobacteria bacterium]|nr:hypothetical protein [Gammaproteobacteria bacterium]MCW8987619.1 hypothetical protein [Gammaproteobacteria bacterium]MCW9032189.1 hypothetical protein [Gammaproteobacteria bacterium]